MSIYKPHLIRSGQSKKPLLWCACGLSKNQPFCDGAHKGTGIKPIPIKAKADSDMLLCTCKATASPPFCDGTHNNLGEPYDEGKPPKNEGELVKSTTGDALLDGNIFVHKAKERKGLTSIVTKKQNAHHLSHTQIVLEQETYGPFYITSSEAVLFVSKGQGIIKIAGKTFHVGPETSVFIRPGETITLTTHTTLSVAITVCPGRNPIRMGESHSPFDNRIKTRIASVDPKTVQAMGNRFFQVLVGENMGSKEITQFLGIIPKGYATPHRHLYEEVITILSGHGQIRSQSKRTEIKSGDVIFLPRKQLHALDCFDKKGMRLVGTFYPAGSPAINY